MYKAILKFIDGEHGIRFKDNHTYEIGDVYPFKNTTDEHIVYLLHCNVGGKGPAISFFEEEEVVKKKPGRPKKADG